MYKTKNSMPESTRAQMVDLLNSCLATCLDAGMNSKQAHWNVKGPNFIALHELFDQIYQSFSGYSDLIAERLVQLGGIAEGTAQFASKKSCIKEYPVALSEGHSHIEYLSDTLSGAGVFTADGATAAAGTITAAAGAAEALLSNANVNSPAPCRSTRGSTGARSRTSKRTTGRSPARYWITR